MPGRWGEAPFVAVSAAFVLGIACASCVAQCCFAALALGAVALVAAAALAFLSNRQGVALWLGLSCVTIAGALTAIAQRDGYGRGNVRTLLRAGTFPLNQPLPFEGCISEERARDATDIIVRMELRALRTGETWQPRQGSVLLRVPSDIKEGGTAARTSLRYGDRVRGWAQFDIRRNFRNPGAAERYEALARRGIHLVGRVKSPLLLEVIPGDCSSWWQRAPSAVRHRVERELAVLEERGQTRESAILASTLVGDYSGLDSDTRDAFQNSGTFHVLVVSGLHVAWIAWALLQGFRGLRCPETASRVAVGSAILFYTAVVGFQASISRSFWMFTVYLAGRVFFRKGAPVNVAAAAAALLLAANPDWLFDAGFQLSFLSVAAICLLGAPCLEQVLRPVVDPARRMELLSNKPLRRTAPERLGRMIGTWCILAAESCGDLWGAWFERVARLLFRTGACVAFWTLAMLVISISVQLWIEPALALHFNRLSWIAPFANLLVVPLSSAVLATGVAAAMTAGIPFLGEPCLSLAAWVASLLYWIARNTSLVGWQRCPTLASAAVVFAVLLLCAWTFQQWRRLWIPCGFVGLLLLFAAAGWAPSWLQPGRSMACAPVPFRNEMALSLTFLDVGQGDSAVIRYPNGTVWIVDAGGMRQIPNAVNQFDIGEVVVSRYLWNSWITDLDRVLITHAHDDHAGGVPALLRNFRVAQLEHGGEDSSLARIFSVARSRSVPTHMARAGEMRNIGGVEVETLWPPRSSGFPSANESSIVLHLRYGNFAALLTGDLERSAETEIVAGVRSIRSLLLKVAHHGSRYGTHKPMLDRVQPRWAVISAGRNNPFGNPSRELLMRLLRCGARPLATMDLGAISFATDGHAYSISSYTSGTLERGVL